MVDEEIAADLRARMNVDRRDEARPVVDDAGEEEQAVAEQRMGDPVIGERPHARIEQDLGMAARRGIARADRI